MTEKQIKILGIVASIMAVGMYVAYIPQIADNLAGHKGNPVQPFVAFVNCTLWTGYGLFKKPRDWQPVLPRCKPFNFAVATFSGSLLPTRQAT